MHLKDWLQRFKDTPIIHFKSLYFDVSRLLGVQTFDRYDMFADAVFECTEYDSGRLNHSYEKVRYMYRNFGAASLIQVPCNVHDHFISVHIRELFLSDYPGFVSQKSYIYVRKTPLTSSCLLERTCTLDEDVVF